MSYTNSNSISRYFDVPTLLSGGKLPEHSSEQAAGADLFLPDEYDTVVVAPMQLVKVKLMLSVKIPNGMFGMLEPRSSQRAKKITFLGSGIIDSDYRGELAILVMNLGDTDYIMKSGDKVAQLILVPYMRGNYVDIWNDTGRGAGGFGSTGV